MVLTFWLQAFWSGALGRAIATVMLFPYTRAKVLKQSRRRSLRADSVSCLIPVEDDDEDEDDNGKPATKKKIPLPKGVSRQASLTTSGVIAAVVKNEGIMGLYRGMGPEVRRCLCGY
jgi:hypothetical protein